MTEPRVTDETSWPPPVEPPHGHPSYVGPPPPAPLPAAGWPYQPQPVPNGAHDDAQAQADFPYGLKARVKKALAPLVAAGAFLAKFGLILLKIKSVVFLGSAAISVAAYAQLWGWRYAVGFVALILVHELGHVIALRLRGIKASALVFLPLLGAFTAWEPEPRSAYEDAETALAGPMIGAAASLALGYYAHLHHSPLCMSLAFTGLAINLFNMVPVKPLDGSKVVDLLAPWTWIAGEAGLVLYALYRPGGLVLVFIVLVGVQIYRQGRDYYGTFARAAATIEPRLRNRLSAIYLVVAAVTLIGMHATYAKHTLA